LKYERHYRLRQFLPWTKLKVIKMLVISIIPTSLYYFAGWSWLAIPWVPVALVGTATAFISGFKNTQTYNRTWEARQIWGCIINSSRSFGIMVRDFLADPALTREFMYRHFAWLCALRFQLREVKSWENVKTKSYNLAYLKYYVVPEWEGNLEEELKEYLEEEERIQIVNTKNRATQVLAKQSSRWKEVAHEKGIDNHRYVAMVQVFKELYDHQGKCERIKNFPYPRQFSSINLYFTNLLCLIMPMGFLGELSKMVDRLGPEVVWLALPLSTMVGWIFLVLEQIGESTENPFEGGANDIPITQISRILR
jgi:putative membrane protein